VDDLGDGIVATTLVPDLHLLPGLWKIDGYTAMVQSIQARYEVRENENLFTFPYDWRRDNRVAARRLERQSREWLDRWKQSSGNANARLILVAHSMGGLVSRYFLEVLGGWERTRALITFGTPYRGALNSLDSLANGMRQAGGLVDLTDLGRSLTAIYQLLPIYKCYDPGNGTLVRVAEADIPNVDRQKAEAALRFHREIEEAVKENQKLEKYREEGYRMYPVVGIRQETSQAGIRDGNRVRMVTSHPGLDFGGDGTVPRPSATPIELSDDGREMFAATRHGSLQNADAVLVHLDGVLSGLALNTGDLRDEVLRTLPPVKVSLQVEDLYLAGETVTVRARPDQENVPLAVTLTETQTGQGTQVPLQPGLDGWHTASFGPLPAGAYRVEVRGPQVEPAADAFAVADAAPVPD
jgi:pimeloyl-ACP methyl ester carboxylesterase